MDDVAYNGRVHRDASSPRSRAARRAAEERLAGSDPTQADPVDHLPCPYLIFVCDFDAADGDATASCEAYLRELWSAMEQELRATS